MGLIKLFVKQSCAKCPQAKQLGSVLKDEGYNVIEYDVTTVDGLAEASFYSVQATPTFILEDDDENLLGDFRGEVPAPEKIKEMLG
ncbi:MAG: thioredoxin family protein [Deltaproteobacteria bacterium]|nr:thioredoxin family protein [Deltaproteobacteria bacterium]